MVEVQDIGTGDRAWYLYDGNDFTIVFKERSTIQFNDLFINGLPSNTLGINDEPRDERRRIIDILRNDILYDIEINELFSVW